MWGRGWGVAHRAKNTCSFPLPHTLSAPSQHSAASNVCAGPSILSSYCTPFKCTTGNLALTVGSLGHTIYAPSMRGYRMHNPSKGYLVLQDDQHERQALIEQQWYGQMSVRLWFHKQCTCTQCMCKF